MARRTGSQFDDPPAGRFVSLLGDAELDEGAIWEAMVDPAGRELGELLWVVDLNRQSLDRVVPDIADRQAAGDVRRGRLAGRRPSSGAGDHRPSSRPGGESCANGSRRCPTRSTSGSPRPAPTRRDRILADGRRRAARPAAIDAAELATAVRDLGGTTRPARRHVRRAVAADRPTVVFAYTVKGRGLPTEGHPNNHSALLTGEQMDELAGDPGGGTDGPWAAVRRQYRGRSELCAERCRGAAA